MPVDITAALIALVAVFLYAVARVVQLVPDWIKHRVDAQLAKHDLEAARVNAEAMRDRAMADAYVSAASSVSQSLAIIQSLASTLDNANTDADMLQRVVISLEQNARELNKLNERLSDNDTDNESGVNRTRIFGDAG